MPGAPTADDEPPRTTTPAPRLPGTHSGRDDGAVRRYLPRFHYELLVCGLRGHAIVGAGRDVGRQPAVAAQAAVPADAVDLAHDVVVLSLIHI